MIKLTVTEPVENDLFKMALNGDNIKLDDTLAICRDITSWPEDVFAFSFENIVLISYSLTGVKIVN